MSPAQAAECPVTTKLDLKLHVLSNETLLKMNPKWVDPAQVSGFTRTDFDSVQPWEISSCRQSFCAKPKSQTLNHQIFLRPEKLKDGKPNPRWIAIDKFPCGSKPHKNFITYSCTIEHEKVHVIQREDALAESCPAFVNALKTIRASSQQEADGKARAAYQTLIRKIAAVDQEDTPYQFEWKCNGELAQKSGVACRSQRNWSRLIGTDQFTEDSIDESTQLTSAGPIGGCAKKQWYFAGATLDQENCVLENGNTKKVFYEFGVKQREIEIDKHGKKLSEKIFFNPKDRITQD